VATRRVPDVKHHSLHIGISYPNPITKSKLDPNVKRNPKSNPSYPILLLVEINRH